MTWLLPAEEDFSFHILCHFSLAPCLKSFFWTRALPEEVCDCSRIRVLPAVIWEQHLKKNGIFLKKHFFFFFFWRCLQLNPLFTWLQVCSLLLHPSALSSLSVLVFSPVSSPCQPNTAFPITSKWTISETFSLGNNCFKSQNNIFTHRDTIAINLPCQTCSIQPLLAAGALVALSCHGCSLGLLGIWGFKRHSLCDGPVSTKPWCHKLTQMGSCSTFADENHWPTFFPHQKKKIYKTLFVYLFKRSLHGDEDVQSCRYKGGVKNQVHLLGKI